MCSRKQNSEDGIVIILLVIILPALMILVALAAFPSYARLTHSELQTAVDSAAHAAALTICSSQECFDTARQRAVEVLSHFPIHGRDGGAMPFLLDPAAGPKWIDPNEYEITILRGAWWPEGAPERSIFSTLTGEKRFILLETEDGTPPPPTSFAAIFPGYLAANAIYVKVTLKNYHDPLAFVASEGIEISADAIAVGGSTQSVAIAPFAVPVCSIVEPNGAFNPATICDRDFFFARRDRYCPANDPNCNVVPGMFGTPRRDFSGMYALEQCSWLQEPIASDVFGFVGSSGTVATEADLVSAISNGGIQTHLGDKFHPLESGFTSIAAFSEIQNKMQTFYPSLGDGWLGAMRYPDDTMPGSGLDYPWTLIPNNPMDCSVPENRGWGACNSVVFAVTDQDSWSPNAGVPDSCMGPIMGSPIGWLGGYSPFWPQVELPPAYWPTKAAVVAWDDMTACQGPDGGAIDPPPPLPGAELRVIGYVDLAMYDLDIGAPPPAPPSVTYTKGHDYWPDEDYCDQIEVCDYGEQACWNLEYGPPDWNYECESPYSEESCGSEWICHDVPDCTTDPDTGIETCTTVEQCDYEDVCHEVQYCCGRAWECHMTNSPWCSSINPHSCAGPNGTNKAGTSHTPWGFTPPVAQGDPNFQCNLVRGRISCDNSMVPSGTTGVPREVTLVR